MKRYLIFTALIIFTLLSTILSAQKTEPVILNKTTLDGKKIGLNTEYFFDKTMKETIDSIRKKTSLFKKSKKESLGFGYRKSAVWLHFKIKNPEQNSKTWYLELAYPLTDLVTLYFPQKKIYNSITEGDLKPYKERKYDHENFIFQLNSEPGIHDYFLKITSESSMNIPLIAWSRKVPWKRWSPLIIPL